MTERVLPREFNPPPEFLIPLSNDELLEFGTFTAVWSQIDVLMLWLIAHITKSDFFQLELIMENMTTGPRVNILKKLCAESKDPIDKEIKKSH
jgi:hypothetical protein